MVYICPTLMTFLLKGEYALSQFDDVEITGISPYTISLYNDTEHLSENWRKKIVKLTKIGQFSSVILTSFRLVILESAPPNAIALVA